MRNVTSTFLITTIIIIFSLDLNSKTLWQDSNPYSPGSNLKIGDVVIININDFSKMKFSLKIKENKKSDVNSNPDTTITGFLPKVGSTKNFNSDNSIDFSNNGKFNLLVSSRITGKAGGKLKIAGTKIYQINDQFNRITVTGFVDPLQLNGRSIDSDKVADMRINIRSTGRGFNLKREALKPDEKATSELTEKEKQQIIIDYLQKMLGEITR